MPALLYLLLITLSLIWGASFFFIKVLLTYYNPFAIVFFRSLFGVIVVLIIMLMTKKKIIPPKAPWLLILIVGIFNSVFPWSLISFSETLLSSSMASILNATTPIWTVLVGILFFKTKVQPIQWAGIIIGFVGIFVLLDIDISQLQIDNFYGFLGMISATFFYGLSAQMSRRYFSELSSFQIALFTLITSTVITSIIVPITGSYHWNYLIENPKTLLSFIGLGGFGSGIAYLIFYYIIQKGSAEFASLVTYLVPISALVWGVAILSESVKVSMILGLILILVGVYVSSYKKKQRKQVILENDLVK